ALADSAAGVEAGEAAGEAVGEAEVGGDRSRFLNRKGRDRWKLQRH
ncbi:MAG: hypothetical protein GDYSWBUE_000001, partial [Candidatus Fervidibacterota bacterium]